jgi:hypothetical protein
MTLASFENTCTHFGWVLFLFYVLAIQQINTWQWLIVGGCKASM